MNPKHPDERNRVDQPFLGMKIDDSTNLECLETRSSCSQCGKSRMYFCYTCYLPVNSLKGNIPFCKLPIKVDIIKHIKEIDGKSTSAHAAILAPEDVTVYTYPDIPDYQLDGRTVLLYPGAESRTVQELFSGKHIDYTKIVLSELPDGFNVGTLRTKTIHDDQSSTIYHVHKLPIDHVVVIDSTWNQSRGIFCDERLQKLPKIVLQNRISQFWRHQKGSPRWYLSTIEAIHQLMLEIHLCAWGRANTYKSLLTLHYPVHDTEDLHLNCKPYSGEYDNLLYFFKYMYEKLHQLYKHEDLQAYKRPMT